MTPSDLRKQDVRQGNGSEPGTTSVPALGASVLDRHHDANAVVQATAEELFAHLDDHTRLSAHMDESSWMMAGGRMHIELDEARGQQVGSRIRLQGRVFGISLRVEEIVTERRPFQRKIWETTTPPRLLVIGSYRMGFEITPQGADSQLRVFIDYALPDRAPSRWLGRLFGRFYAGWCTRRMADDAVRHFWNALPPAVL